MTQTRMEAPKAADLPEGVAGLRLVWFKGEELRNYEAFCFRDAAGVNRILRVLAAFGMLTSEQTDYQLDYVADDAWLSILGEINLTKRGFDFFRRKWRPLRDQEYAR